MQDIRKLNIMFHKSGSGSITCKLSLPKSWVDKLSLNKENRTLNAIFDDETNTINLSALSKKDS